MFRILYFNINFVCNNSCIFCFSHNTFFDNSYLIHKNDIIEILMKYKVSSNDRIIINGGEPTLHPELLEIIRLFHKTGAEIIVYTNGRKLKDVDYCCKLVRMVNRIVVPVHGEESVHDNITQKKGSFIDTICGIKNILMLNSSKLELKFIVTKNMICSDFSINNFLFCNHYEPSSVALTGVVPTAVSQLNNVSLPSPDELGKYVSCQLDELIFKYNGSIKLFDCELCRLTHELREYIDKLPLEVDNHIYYNYYYFEVKYRSGKLIRYNDDRKCENCNLTNICRRISDACIVLELCHDAKKIVLE